MAVAVIFGRIVSTALTLIVVPVTYHTLEELSASLQRVLARLQGFGKRPERDDPDDRPDREDRELASAEPRPSAVVIDGPRCDGYNSLLREPGPIVKARGSLVGRVGAPGAAPRMAAGHAKSLLNIRGCSSSLECPRWPRKRRRDEAREIEENGGVQEWLIWRARKARVRATVPWVRIPPPPPCALHFCALEMLKGR